MNLFFAGMTIWSLVMTLITDPGYIPDSFFVGYSHTK
jgi:hypothetical protein